MIPARAALVCAALLGSTSCKKTVPERHDPMLGKFEAIADRMCACHDTACAHATQAEMNQWSAERLKMSLEERKASPDESRRLQEAAARYGECLKRVVPGSGSGSGASAEVVIQKLRQQVEKTCACTSAACIESAMHDLAGWSWTSDLTEAQRQTIRSLEEQLATCRTRAAAPPTTDENGLAVAPSTPLLDADKIVHHTYRSLGRYVVAELALSYVRASGELDPKYGVARIALGIAKPADPEEDPDRPLGAPVAAPEPPPDVSRDRCPVLTWTKGMRNTTLAPCALALPIVRPRCTVAEVWKRAIAAKAPPEGLATLSYRPGTWTFAIDDAPRKVHVQQDIADTCEAAAEKPN